MASMRRLVKAIKDSDPDEVQEALVGVGGKAALNSRELGFVSRELNAFHFRITPTHLHTSTHLHTHTHTHTYTNIHTHTHTHVPPHTSTHQDLLPVAVETGSVEVVEMLIKAGCDVNGTDKRGRSALVRAFEEEQLEIFVLLLQNGADPNATLDKSTLLCAAIDEGYVWGRDT